jgi:hypothetical protein
VEFRAVLKRVGFSDFRSNAQDDAEAYTMPDAANRLRMRHDE